MPDRFRWIIVVLLFSATILNLIDRAVIAFAADQIQSEIGLSASQLGFVFGAIGIGYIISTIGGSFAVDRLGTRLALAACLIFWSISIGWTGLASGFAALLMARMVMGLAEGPGYPAMTSAFQKWLPPDERATVLAGILVAMPLALAIGSPLVAVLIDTFGWRSLFYLLCFFGFVLLPIWFYFFADEPSDSPLISNQERLYIDSSQRNSAAKSQPHVPSRSDWQTLLSNRTLLANYWAFFVAGYFIFFFMTWMPKFLHDSFDLGLSQIGYFAFLPWIAAAAALVYFGRWSDATLKQTRNLHKSRSQLIAGSQLVAAVGIIPVIYFDSLYVAMASFTLVVAASMAAGAAFYAVISEMVPRIAGTAMTIMTSCFAAAGFFAPVITGFTVDLTGSYVVSFWTMTVLGLSSVIGIVLFHNPDLDRGQLMRKLA
ncbi:MAG: MFS transporter [Pseudomonadota bacterium]